MKVSAKTGIDKAGFTKKDLLVLLAALCALVFITPYALVRLNMAGDPYAPVSRAKCMSNLKQIALAHQLYAADYSGKFPSDLDSNSNYVGTEVWVHFLSLSNQLQTPKILICPADRARINNMAADFTTETNGLASPSLRNLAISYFVGLKSGLNTKQAILTGDRNLALDRKSAPLSTQGQRPISVPSSATWSDDQTAYLHDGVGNIALANGSVIQASRSELRQKLIASEKAYGTNANLFLFPQ